MEPNIKKYYTQLLNDIHRKHIALENKMTQNYNMLDGDQIDAINRTASDEFKVSSFDKYKDSNVVIMSYLTDYNTNKSVSSSSLGDYNELKLFIYDNNNLPLLGSSKVPKQRIFSSVLKDAISHIGYYRFNTNIVRNMFFISNILRIIRLQINREFTQNRNILKSSHFAISPSITEYGTMNPNEAYNSNYRGEREFNDESGKFYDEV
jgi:hypothetical protein